MDENPQQQVEPTAPRADKRRWVIGGVVAALVIVVGLATWALFYKPGAKDGGNGDSGNVAASGVCSSGLIGEANAPLANSDQVALASVVDKIKKLKNFESDPNCLYIVLQYDLATGNATASRSDLNKYEKVYDPVVGLSDAFTVSIMPVKELRNNVSFLEESAKASEANEKKDTDNLSSGSDAADKFQREHK